MVTKLINNLKSKQMELKRAKVIMLPEQGKKFKESCGCTEEHSCPYESCNHGYFNGNLYYHGDRANLYFTTDDEIKEGDWCIITNKTGTQFIAKNNGSNYKLSTGGFVNVTGHSYKIIATTDKSLKYTISPYLFKSGGACKSKNINLPQPSQAFIEKYCKVGGIDEVNVEYTDKLRCYKCGKSEIDCINTSKNCLGYFEANNILKVDAHNTITIHPIKTSWTKEEVIKLLNMAYTAGYCNHLGTQPLLQEEWIKENL